MTGYVLDTLLFGLLVYAEWLRRTENRQIATTHETRANEIKADYEKRIVELQNKLAAAEEQLRTSRKEEVCQVKADCEARIVEMKSSCESRIEDMKASSESRVSEMKATCDSRVAEVQAKVTKAEQKVRETEKKCDERIAAAEREPAVASYSFSMQKETGRVFKKIREVTLMATFQHGKLVHWSGDLSYMEDLKIPAFIRKALQGALAAAQVMTGAPPIPRLT